jgi:hypothetical protein
MAGAWAMGRAMDDAIIAAATGTAYSGVAGGTSVSLPAGNKVAHGGVGLSVTKLLNAKEILDANDIDPDEPRFLVCSAGQLADLLAITQITSADYNSVKALVDGQTQSVLDPSTRTLSGRESFSISDISFRRTG